MLFSAFLPAFGLLGLTVASPLVTPAEPFRLMKRACTVAGLSCSSTPGTDLCCYESPGGQLLLTQFWDTAPVTGPVDSWTMHGLWPDHCDGTYDSNCDSAREYTTLAAFLSAQSPETLSYMQQYWVDLNGDNESFWEHEWGKHGTCMSTLKVACLPSGSPKGADAVAYFKTTVKLFKALPTYTWLASQGITPHATTTRTYAALVAALKTASGGYEPALDCSSGKLNGISWYFNLRGSAIDGTFVPFNAPTKGSCPTTGIVYAPKTSGGGGGGGDGTLPAKATITAIRSGATAATGGLLSLGTWSTQTLATYTMTGSVTGFTMTSSKGTCGVSSGTFSCGSGISSTFTAVTSGTNLLLAYDGSTAFTSSGLPSGTTVYPVLTGSASTYDYTLRIVSS